MADHIFTNSNFKAQVLESKIPVVVDFWAEWCAPCKIIEPHLDDLAKEYHGKVLIGKMDADNNPQIQAQYNVMSLPTVMFFKDGKPIHAMIGAQGKHAYKTEIEKVLNS